MASTIIHKLNIPKFLLLAKTGVNTRPAIQLPICIYLQTIYTVNSAFSNRIHSLTFPTVKMGDNYADVHLLYEKKIMRIYEIIESIAWLTWKNLKFFLGGWRKGKATEYLLQTQNNSILMTFSQPVKTLNI